MKKISIIFFLIVFTQQIVAQLDCSKIIIDIDKFSGDTTFKSPSYLEFLENDLVYFIKFKTVKRGNRTYIKLKTYGSTLNVSEKGVIILLANGAKIEKPEQKIKCEVAEGGQWEYSANVNLDDKDIEKMILSPMTDFRLYVYDAHLDENKAKKYMEELKCLKDK